MERQQLIEKTAEALRPFETNNLIDTLQHMSINKLFANPVVLILIVVIFFYGVVKRSKTVLLCLFSLFVITLIIRFAMPNPGDGLSFQNALPFVGGCFLIACVVIYFSLIKSD